MRVVVVSLLAMLAAVTGRAQPVARDIDARPALFPLFVSCDIVLQFVTPGLDEDTLIRLDSPVSLEGARMLGEARKQCVVARFPLLLEPAGDRDSIESAPVARFDARFSGAQMRLVADSPRDLYDSVPAALPARTDPSTWVRIRALFGR